MRVSCHGAYSFFFLPFIVGIQGLTVAQSRSFGLAGRSLSCMDLEILVEGVLSEASGLEVFLPELELDIPC